MFIPPVGVQFTNISEMKNRFKKMQRSNTQNTQEEVQKSLQELRNRLGN